MPPAENLESLLTAHGHTILMVVGALVVVALLLYELRKPRRRKDPCAYGPVFQALRTAVLARTNNRCVGCGTTRGLQLHHITSGPYPCGCNGRAGAACSRRARVTAEDLAPLCPLCHDGITIVRRMLRRKSRAAVAIALKARLARLPQARRRRK